MIGWMGRMINVGVKGGEWGNGCGEWGKGRGEWEKGGGEPEI